MENIEEFKVGKEVAVVKEGKMKVTDCVIEEVENEEYSLKGKQIVLIGVVDGLSKSIRINKAKYKHARTERLVEGGLWINKDEEGNLPYHSGLAILMRHYGIDNLKSLVGREVECVSSETGFLIVKAY